MKDILANSTARLDRVAQTIRERFGSLSEAELNWTAGPNRWSIAQIMDHLIVFNGAYATPLGQIVDGSYRPNLFARWKLGTSMVSGLLRRVSDPNNRKKVRTVAPFHPGSTGFGTEILDKYQQSHEAFVRLLNSIPAEAAGTVISSPANKMMTIHLTDLIEIIASHAERHLLQMIETYELQRQVA